MGIGEVDSYLFYFRRSSLPDRMRELETALGPTGIEIENHEFDRIAQIAFGAHSFTVPIYAKPQKFCGPQTTALLSEEVDQNFQVTRLPNSAVITTGIWCAPETPIERTERHARIGVEERELVFFDLNIVRDREFSVIGIDFWGG